MRTKEKIRSKVEELVRRYRHRPDLVQSLTGFVLQCMGEVRKEVQDEILIEEMLYSKLDAAEELLLALNDGELGTSNAYNRLKLSLNKLSADYKKALEEYGRKNAGSDKTREYVSKIKREWGRHNVSKQGS